jgi:hypothetical protein
MLIFSEHIVAYLLGKRVDRETSTCLVDSTSSTFNFGVLL